MSNPRIPRKWPDVGWQIHWMSASFPQFRYSGQTAHWRGALRPQRCSPEYVVEVQYRGKRAPRAIVRRPEIDPAAPHRYADGSLCLYYPCDWHWTGEKNIAHTIVPWTAFWLYCYEHWQEDGEWYNDEAPHERTKRQTR